MVVAHGDLDQGLQDEIAGVLSVRDEQGDVFPTRRKCSAEAAQLVCRLDLDVITDDDVEIKVGGRVPIAATE
jgi:hypothetical protein